MMSTELIVQSLLAAVTLGAAGGAAYIRISVKSAIAQTILDTLNGRYLKADVANEKFQRVCENIERVQDRVQAIEQRGGY